MGLTSGQGEARAYHFTADLYRGFVSLEYLKSLDNTYSTGVKLRSKHLVFISHEQSLLQISKGLNVTTFKQPEEMKIETLADLTAQEDESKVSNVVSKSAVRSEYSNVSTPHLLQAVTANKPCIKCKFHTEGVAILTCSECKDSWHVQCLEKEYQSKVGMVEKAWRCPSCIRCTHCHSMIGSESRMLLCKCCNSPYHADCLDPSFRCQVPQYILEFEAKWAKEQKVSKEDQTETSVSSLLQVEFKCQTCIKCISCGAKEAGKSKLHKWSKDFNFCSNCNRKRKARHFCQVCEEMWPSENIEELTLPGPNQMILCNSCSTCSHVKCDLILLNQAILDQMLSGYLSYCCQACRKERRLALLTQLVTELESEDKNGYYIEEFWLENEQFTAVQSKQYLRQIKNPMCFKIIKSKIQKYLESPEQLKLDCLQIFLNAKSYNKYNTAIHKDAERLYQICLEKLTSYMPLLEK